METDQNQTSEINATIKGIDNGMLILETSDDKQLIRWPLHKLPSSLNIGDPLAIKLQSNSTSFETPSAGNEATRDNPDALRQKLLEELIN